MLTETKTPANEGADVASTSNAGITARTSATMIERMEREICILLPLVLSSFAFPVLLFGCGLRGVRRPDCSDNLVINVS